MKNGLLITGVILLATGTFLLIRKSIKDSNPGATNFESLRKNLGANIPLSSDGNSLYVTFNDAKNSVRFYNNNRFAIFAGQKEVGKGSYSNGGLSLALDGGKKVDGPSVYTNLNSIL